jgi:hypothetical protein
MGSESQIADEPTEQQAWQELGRTTGEQAGTEGRRRGWRNRAFGWGRWNAAKHAKRIHQEYLDLISMCGSQI